MPKDAPHLTDPEAEARSAPTTDHEWRARAALRGGCMRGGSGEGRGGAGGGGGDLVEDGVVVGQAGEERPRRRRAPGPRPREHGVEEARRRPPRRSCGRRRSRPAGVALKCRPTSVPTTGHRAGDARRRRARRASPAASRRGPARPARRRRRRRAGRARRARRRWPAGSPTACRPGTRGRAAPASPSRSARPPKAPIGRPPPMTLPKLVRSGATPYSAWAPPRPRRKPVITSSKIEQRADRGRTRRAAPRGSPAPGATRPMLAATGSTMTHGHVVVERRAPTLYGTTIVSATAAAGTPAVPGQAERGHAAAAGGEQRVGAPW